MFHPAYLHQFANRVTGHQVGRRFVPQRTILFACTFCGEHLGTTAASSHPFDLTEGGFVRKSLAQIHPTIKTLRDTETP